jgi:hypothetical protein
VKKSGFSDTTRTQHTRQTLIIELISIEQFEVRKRLLKMARPVRAEIGITLVQASSSLSQVVALIRAASPPARQHRLKHLKNMRRH